MRRALFALREPRLAVFGPDEVGLVSQIISDCWATMPNEMSGLLYRFIGWQAAEDGADIPYELVHVSSSSETSEHVRRKAQELDATARDRLASKKG